MYPQRNALQCYAGDIAAIIANGEDVEVERTAMLDRSIRVVKEQVLVPVAQRVDKRIHPTTVTIVAGVVGIAAAAAAWQQMYVLGLVLWALNRVLDGLDGTLARATNQQSDLGGYIDILLDDLTYSLIVFAFAVGVGTVPAFIAAGFLLVMYRVNAASWMYLSSLLEKRAVGSKSNEEMTSITMPAGLVEGTETVIFYVLFYLFPSFIVPLFWAFGVLVGLTVVQRMIWAVRVLD